VGDDTLRRLMRHRKDEPRAAIESGLHLRVGKPPFRLNEIHDRMPVILAPGDWGLWLGEEGKGAARLMSPAPNDLLIAHRVAREVNSNRATGPQLIDPLDMPDGAVGVTR